MSRPIPNEFFLVPKIRVSVANGVVTRDACGGHPDFYIVEKFHATFDTVVVVPKARLDAAIDRIRLLEIELSNLKAQNEIGA
jgi:hypothetical protein